MTTPLEGLLLDAAGTLLRPAEPIAVTYARAAQAFGGPREVSAIAAAFGPAMARHRAARRGDPHWLTYWRKVVEDATGVADPALTDVLYRHFATPEAWQLAPGAEACIAAAHRLRISVAVVSNWDVRLRPLLTAMDIGLDALVVSGEEPFEKPDPRMFVLACDRLGISPARALMVGDTHDDDLAGALAAGCQALVLGAPELPSFAALTELLERSVRRVVRSTP